MSLVRDVKGVLPSEGEGSLLMQYAVLLHLVLLFVSFPIQVETGIAKIGLISYFPVSVLFVYMLWKFRHWSAFLEPTDIVIALFCFFPLFHLLFFVINGNELATSHLKFPFIYFNALIVYLYFRFYASKQTVMFALTTIIVLAVLYSMHWMYDSYQKTVLGEVSSYSRKMLDYISIRNGLDINNVNLSVTGPQYRSYGILPKHSFTGAFVAIGFLVLIYVYAASSVTLRILTFSACSMILFVGGQLLVLADLLYPAH